MSIRRALALALCALLLPPTASAEKRISDDSAGGLFARQGWVSWTSFQHGGRVLWRDGRVRPFPAVADEPFGLGTDAKGRTEVLYRDDGVWAQRLTGGRARPLVGPSRGLTDAAESGGAVAWLNASGIHLRARGARRARRVRLENARDLSLAGRWLVAHTYDQRQNVDRFVAIDTRHPKAAARTLMTDDHYDEDCRCTSGSSDPSNLQTDGRYAYWLETSFVSRDGAGGGYDRESDAIRVDPTRPEVRGSARLPHPVTTSGGLAVDNGALLYASAWEPGVYRAPAPAWSGPPGGR